MLGCRPGKAWVRSVGIRHNDAGGRPICLTELYIDAAYRALAKDATSLRTAFWSLIERHFGETVVEVEQVIEAAMLTTERAANWRPRPARPRCASPAATM